MPELPEVETIRQDLRKKVLSKKIVKVVVAHGKAVNNQTAKFIATLTNNKIVDIERRGKLMVFRLGRTANILVHLKMTGQLIYERSVGNKVEVVAGGHKLIEKDFDLPNKHTQVIITFADGPARNAMHSVAGGGKLFFNDLRRFGYMKLAIQSEVEQALTRFGIEPLTKNFTWPAFVDALGKRHVAIKAALMDQPKIAGIGNIYADEICFCAGVLPTRKASSLKISELKRLYRCTSTVIRKAIRYRGTTFKDYLDSEGKKGNYSNFLKVYERAGEKCKRCGHIIQKIKSGGRGTHFCPGCQK